MYTLCPPPPFKTGGILLDILYSFLSVFQTIEV
jgi:hypothetical protein